MPRQHIVYVLTRPPQPPQGPAERRRFDPILRGKDTASILPRLASSSAIAMSAAHAAPEMGAIFLMKKQSSPSWLSA
ncbi:hypothetical protein EYZ11_006988 [Aspergillus tanneri]|uniref:Uncharacterized protein n=1 Tax=Aspergillus tanneri TaxID=1220188 RepID=A0A4S3JGH6_9EURO|nr:hypothetical protein EYZ11_006988 [Aspergillus tanneri]